MQNRVGLYAWGGPGTIRLLKTKYHDPKIDEQSFLSLYDFDVLKAAQSQLGLTDIWATYSWGFSDQTEQEDYDFIRSKLPNFQQLNLKTHAYIQGFNVVTKGFEHEDIFCHDWTNHLLPYSKGRSLTCPNNPRAQEIILKRVRRACEENFDGIYIDNLLFGLPPMYVSEDFTSIFGCACVYCQKKFQNMFGYDLPQHGFDHKTLRDFLHFRQISMSNVLQKIHAVTSQKKKQLGVNLYDPLLHTSELYFGYTVQSLEKYLSYFFVENHSHPLRLSGGNTYLRSFIAEAKKPVFVLSYKDGIGFERQFNKTDVDAIFREAKELGYSPCLKGTEYRTDGVWHALRLEETATSGAVKSNMQDSPSEWKKLSETSFLWKICVLLLQNYYAAILNSIYERKILTTLVMRSGLFQKQLWSIRRWIMS